MSCPHLRLLFSDFTPADPRAELVSCGRHLQRRQPGISLPLAMRTVHVLGVLLLLNVALSAASKPHVVSLGKPLPVKLFIGAAESKTMDIAVRPLFVDA